MPEASPTATGLCHAVFLERAAREHDSPQGRLGQAGFLVLRLVDLLGPGQPTRPRDDHFRYQAAATARYCREQLEAGAHADHLLGVAHHARDAQRRRNPGRIAPALLALARLLEEEARYEEALDALETLERVAESHLTPAHAVAAALQVGRTNRELARFDTADAAYARADALATALGDRHSVLLSRLGRANVFRGRGNLVEAERWDWDVLHEAHATSDRDAEARAEHNLGVVLGAQGKAPDAIPHLWRAFGLYEDETQSLRALQDLGVALSRLGAIEGAERALRRVVDRSRIQYNVQNAMVELMNCASFRRDRVGFTRWQTRCNTERPHMAPNILVDCHLKVGVGLARFGQFARAATELELALRIAQTHGLHEFEFRIERIRAGLGDCDVLEPAKHGAVPEPVAEGPALAEVSAALATLEG